MRSGTLPPLKPSSTDVMLSLSAAGGRGELMNRVSTCRVPPTRRRHNRTTRYHLATAYCPPIDLSWGRW